VVANGLENALMAASQLGVADKWVKFYCEIKQNNILIKIQNTYTGQVIIRDGLPVSGQKGHGYGCHSIDSIVRSNGGHCSFNADNGLFTLRIVIPVKTN
jgi:sensor histidine kinase regulating citrate/malate metabolism